MPSNTRRAFRGLAFGHPLRVSIFNHLAREGEASPKELATALGQPLGNVSYHVRELVNLGIMKGSRTASRRGAVEHYYVLTITPKELFEELMGGAGAKPRARRRR
jgi:DNA-binding transcriptional ArsR family regulator